MTDFDLLRDDASTREAFKRGDKWALTEVYRVYYPLVTTVITRGFGGFRGFFNPSDRDDAIQSVFAAALSEKARLRYNGVDAYSSFLRGIAQNVVRRMLDRRTKFMRTDGQPELENKVVPTAESSYLTAEATLVVRAFRESIDDPIQRAVLQQYFVDGVAEETIAKELSITRYKVRKVIALLDRRMRRYLRQHGLP